MRDPLRGFDWSRLYGRYDALCTRFDGSAHHLSVLPEKPQSDRDLYYHLVRRLRRSSMGDLRPSIDLYEAVLYWKLYTQRAALANLRGWLKADVRPGEASNFARLLSSLPVDLPRDERQVVSAVQDLGSYCLAGMKSETALPVRTTLLHFLFPDVIPIFDQMVLKAVDEWEPGANQRIDVLRRYLPFAWRLADEHGVPAALAHRFTETPIRLVDMALWVIRGTAR